jgi:hypothetical protein
MFHVKYELNHDDLSGFLYIDYKYRNGDTLALWCENATSTGNITVSEFNFFGMGMTNN